MLSKRRCIATGVVNFFVQNEPHLAVASVVKPARADRYVWRYHGEDCPACGTAFDLRAAETAVNEHHRHAMRSHGDGRVAA